MIPQKIAYSLPAGSIGCECSGRLSCSQLILHAAAGWCQQYSGIDPEQGEQAGNCAECMLTEISGHSFNVSVIPLFTIDIRPPVGVNEQLTAIPVLTTHG